MHPTFPADRTTGRRESVRVQANHGPDGQTVHHVYKFSAYPETSGDRKGPSHGVRGTALKGETESTSGEAVRSSDVGLAVDSAAAGTDAGVGRMAVSSIADAARPATAAFTAFFLGNLTGFSLH